MVTEPELTVPLTVKVEVPPVEPRGANNVMTIVRLLKFVISAGGETKL